MGSLSITRQDTRLDYSEPIPERRIVMLTKELRSKIGKIAMAFAIASMICGLAAAPALADRDGDDDQHGHWRHHGRRHYYASRPYYRSYYAPEPGVYYAPPPVVYYPRPSPGLNLFLPFSIR